MANLTHSDAAAGVTVMLGDDDLFVIPVYSDVDSDTDAMPGVLTFVGASAAPAASALIDNVRAHFSSTASGAAPWAESYAGSRNQRQWLLRAVRKLVARTLQDTCVLSSVLDPGEAGMAIYTNCAGPAFAHAASERLGIRGAGGRTETGSAGTHGAALERAVRARLDGRAAKLATAARPRDLVANNVWTCLRATCANHHDDASRTLCVYQDRAAAGGERRFLFIASSSTREPEELLESDVASVPETVPDIVPESMLSGATGTRAEAIVAQCSS